MRKPISSCFAVTFALGCLALAIPTWGVCAEEKPASSQTTAPVQLGAQQGGHAKDCYQYAKDRPNEYVLVLDAATDPPRFFAPKPHTYASHPIRVCIANVDYSKNYQVFANYAELPPPANTLNLIKEFMARGKQETSGIPIVEENKFSAPGLASWAKVKACLKHIDGIMADADAGSQGLSLLNALHLFETGLVNEATAARIQNSLIGYLETVEKKCPAEIRPDIAVLRAEQNNVSNLTSWLNSKQIEKYPDMIDSIKSVLQFGLRHIGNASQNVFFVSSRANSEVEVVVRSMPLVVSAPQQKDIDGVAKDWKIGLSYGAATDVARYSFQIRSLAYVRFGVAVGYSSTHGQSVSTTRNDLGAEVLRRNDDLGITPMVVMTHYWCGADERAIQPWDNSRSCWKWNMAPTIAVGLPITTTNALQQVFLGLVWQPLPAIGFIGGAHLGRVNRMRPEFFDGMAVPLSSSNFRPDVDAIETVTRLGWYVGAVITDATFIKLIRDALGSSSKN
jgi:hypothetical protein